MALRPKHSLRTMNKDKHSAIREFTDREEPTKAFLDALEEKQSDSYKVLTYYGVGGIGKSRLLKELYRNLNRREPLAVSAVLDFKEEKHRTPSEALIWLREELKKQHKIKFTSFDLAYIIYWKKLNPQVSMKSTQEALPFLEEGSFIGEVIDQLENVPVAQWFPKTLKFISGIAKYKDIVQWWMKSGKAVLEQLEDMLPNEIEELLSVYWAEDVRQYVALSSAPAVLFIDTHEALWEKSRQQGAFHAKDAWLQELVLQLPEVLWVIFGREKIQWGETEDDWNNEQHLEQHLMGALSPVDSDKFLQSCGITTKDVRSVIIKASHGLPYHLDLMVDTYKLLEEKHEPQPYEFSKTPQKILDRFLVYLETPEKETLKVLSFTRHWTIELFRHLVTEFQTGFPLTAYLELFRFSFITKEADEQWHMHVMMRTSLQQQVQSADPELCGHVHTVLFRYYNEKLIATGDVSAKSTVFEEAFYHGKLALSPVEFLDWFLDQGRALKNAGQFHLLAVHYEKLQPLLTEEAHASHQAAVHQFFGEIYMLQGNYEQACSEYQAAVEKYQSGLKEHPQTDKALGRCSIDLAEIMIYLNKYEEAYAHLTQGDEQLTRFDGDKDETYYTSLLLQSIRLGKLNIRFAHYGEALDNYLQAVRNGELAADNIGGTSEIFALTALAYEKLGELYAIEQNIQAQDCYMKAIVFYEQALQSLEGQTDIRILTNMGLAHKRLAEHYSATNNPAEKIRSFARALAIYDDVLEVSPYFVDALEKKGHAAVDFMVFQIRLNLLDDAAESFQQASEAFTSAIELSPKRGGSRNRLASAHRELSVLHIKQNGQAQAVASLHESLRLSDLVLSETPDYIYAHNTIAKTHEQLAEVYAASGQQESAETHFQQAVVHYNLMLDRSPGLKEASERKERIEDEFATRKKY